MIRYFVSVVFKSALSDRNHGLFPTERGENALFKRWQRVIENPGPGPELRALIEELRALIELRTEKDRVRFPERVLARVKQFRHRHKRVPQACAKSVEAELFGRLLGQAPHSNEASSVAEQQTKSYSHGRSKLFTSTILNIKSSPS